MEEVLIAGAVWARNKASTIFSNFQRKGGEPGYAGFPRKFETS